MSKRPRRMWSFSERLTSPLAIALTVSVLATLVMWILALAQLWR